MNVSRMAGMEIPLNFVIHSYDFVEIVVSQFVMSRFIEDS